MKTILVMKSKTKINDKATGANARKSRRDQMLTLATISARSNISLAHLAFLERGLRPWTLAIASRVNAALKVK